MGIPGCGLALRIGLQPMFPNSKPNTLSHQAPSKRRITYHKVYNFYPPTKKSHFYPTVNKALRCGLASSQMNKPINISLAWTSCLLNTNPIMILTYDAPKVWKNLKVTSKMTALL
ncbi:hypothetical protein CDAR_489961 [Caerostris darwini]|uniref:Uncharacterized protein n=1 Tax=Caerostris darwini TaxID=1538125 RepID=A0AAV4TM37_9ARAC|nr:hypothetical protein CDAR_489961 [Caerostris darwini]